MDEHGAGVMVKALGLAVMAAVVAVVQVLAVDVALVIMVRRHIFKARRRRVWHSERHRMQSITASQPADLLDRHPFEHRFW